MNTSRTSVNENVSFQMIAASEGTVAVIADKVLLHFGKWTISVLVHHDGLSDVEKKDRSQGQVEQSPNINSCLNI